MPVVEVLDLVEELGDATPEEQAAAAGLVYVDDDEPGYTRRRRGRGFSYHDPSGELVRGAERDRLEGLVVPPAWRDVWLCLHAVGHLQATGRDDADRKQYRYHDRWRELREAAKFSELVAFGAALPAIRERVDADLRRHEASRERVLALLLALLDRTLIRVGNASYAASGGARGLTTLEAGHVELSSRTIRFRFPGKSGRQRDVELHDRRLASQLLRIQDAPDQDLFAYREDGEWVELTSADVNDHLRAITGSDVTAKDFRTWGGTVAALEHLLTLDAPADERKARTDAIAAVDAAAEVLGNTRAVARASYVHPLVLEAHAAGELPTSPAADGPDVLRPAERALLRLLA